MAFKRHVLFTSEADINDLGRRTDVPVHKYFIISYTLYVTERKAHSSESSPSYLFACYKDTHVRGKRK